MSPRAAWRLESYGFHQVCDYAPGKADWLAFGLPYRGSAQLVGALLTHDVATASPRERLGQVHDRLASSPHGLVVVLNHARVVAGVLRSDEWEADPDAAVEDVMREGPTTVRPSEEIEALLERMQRADTASAIVTRSDGTLLGLFERTRAEQQLQTPTQP
ncbi:MAG: CBS domain-containing protein [Actinomycetota bacterium]|nr:CBS domain-containing protein [Actinomycetota bacterium]